VRKNRHPITHSFCHLVESCMKLTSSTTMEEHSASLAKGGEKERKESREEEEGN